MQVARAYGNSHASNYANGLALTAFLTMFPLILGILAVVGLVVHDPTVHTQLDNAIASGFPPDAHAELLDALNGIKHSAGLLGLVSILGLLWGGRRFSLRWSLR